jgi:hypothetical protein
MSSDTGEQAMTEREKRALRAARGVEDGQVIIMRDSKSSSDSSFAKLKDSVLVVGIVAMVGITWNMSIDMAKLGAVVSALERTVQELALEVKHLKERAKP